MKDSRGPAADTGGTARWHGSARSNYFRVKDAEAFKAAITPTGATVWLGVYENADRFAIGGDAATGGWPTEVNVKDIVASHLVDGEVAVFMEAGAEKLRYVSGVAYAINNKGEMRMVCLSDIYDLAKELGPNVTKAHY